jgi:micrococcal nuclease
MLHYPEKAAARRIQIKVVGVHDRDTLTGIKASNEQIKVRLDAIDTPETMQPYGQAAKKALSDMVFGEEVVIYPKTKDKYGRTVGHVVVGKKAVNLAMLAQGMTWHYVKYEKAKHLGQAEAEAKAVRRGLWQNKQLMPPWDWRKLGRSDGAPTTPTACLGLNGLREEGGQTPSGSRSTRPAAIPATAP